VPVDWQVSFNIRAVVTCKSPYPVKGSRDDVVMPEFSEKDNADVHQNAENRHEFMQRGIHCICKIATPAQKVNEDRKIRE
jgi:hypothetical protein